MHLLVGDSEHRMAVHRDHLVAFVQYAVGRRFWRHPCNDHWQILIRSSLLATEKRVR